MTPTLLTFLPLLRTPSSKEEKNYIANTDDTPGRAGRVIVKHYRELSRRSNTAYYGMACGVCRNKKVKCKLPAPCYLQYLRDCAKSSCTAVVHLPGRRPATLPSYKADMYNHRRSYKTHLRILQSTSPLFTSLSMSKMPSFLPSQPNLALLCPLNSHALHKQRHTSLAPEIFTSECSLYV